MKDKGEKVSFPLEHNLCLKLCAFEGIMNLFQVSFNYSNPRVDVSCQGPSKPVVFDAIGN